jgi:hypothetical protein
VITIVQNTIVLKETALKIVEQAKQPIINVVPAQGARGLPGEQGPEGLGAQVIVPAGDLIHGHRVVGYGNLGQLQQMDNRDLDHMVSVLGVSLNAATVGEPVTVATNREVQHSSWSWVMHQPIYLGIEGTLTQVPPESPAAEFLLQVGFPTAPDKLWVEVEYGIEL